MLKYFIFEPNKIQNTLARFDKATSENDETEYLPFYEVDLSIETRQNILDFIFVKK